MERIKKVYLGAYSTKFCYKKMDELKLEASKYNISIGKNVTIGSDVDIGNNVTIGNWVITVNGKIPDNHKIDKLLLLQNAYRYHSGAWVHDGVLFIAMGCFTRTKEEWDNDFWNNEEEFPECSEQGKQRKHAYDTIVQMAEIAYGGEYAK